MTDLRESVTRLSAAVDRLEAMVAQRRPMMSPAPTDDPAPTGDTGVDRLLLDELSHRLDRVIATMRTALGAEP